MRMFICMNKEVSLCFQHLSMAQRVSLLVLLLGVLAFQMVSSHCSHFSPSRASRNTKARDIQISDALDIRLTLSILFSPFYTFLYPLPFSRKDLKSLTLK